MWNPNASEGRQTLAQAFFSIVASIDESLTDGSKWLVVMDCLRRTFPLELQAGNECFPTPKQVAHLRKQLTLGMWGRDEAEVFELICNHLEKISGYKEELDFANMKCQIALQALDWMGRGVLLVNRQCKLLMCNHVAAEVLNRRDGLSVDKELFMVTRASHNAEFRRAVQSVTVEPTAPITISLPRSGMHQAITAVVASPGFDQPRAIREGLALIFLHDPERKVSLEPDLLTRAYGLTHAEARLACMIMDGKSLDEAAKSLAISANTARTHLKRIFLKTDTNRQPQLVLLLMRLAGERIPSVSNPLSVQS
jgi:DNA-binding CsgD family transcriptional regulator